MALPPSPASRTALGWGILLSSPAGEQGAHLAAGFWGWLCNTLLAPKGAQAAGMLLRCS